MLEFCLLDAWSKEDFEYPWCHGCLIDGLFFQNLAFCIVIQKVCRINETILRIWNGKVKTLPTGSKAIIWGVCSFMILFSSGLDDISIHLPIPRKIPQMAMAV